MVIPAKREEGRPLVDALELQADEVAVKTDPALKVGHLQMNMADVCQDLVGKLGLHREKAKARIVAWASVRECHQSGMGDKRRFDSAGRAL